MTKDEIIKALRDMAKYPTVTLPRDSEALKTAADLLEQMFTPPAAQRQWVVFPTMLRKMWSGGEVQAWLDENVNKENT